MGVIINKSLTFKKHIENLLCEDQYKLHALRCIRNFLTVEKVKIPGNDFIDSQFNYVPVIWMFCKKKFYSKIEKNHHRWLVHMVHMVHMMHMLHMVQMVHMVHMILTITFYYADRYRISSNKRRVSNNSRPLISTAPLGINIELSASL